MKPEIKKTLAIAAAALLALVAYYGSYLPYAKSNAFITASRAAQEAKTLAEFMDAAAVPLDMPSPIGQEELTRTVTGNLVDILRNLGKDKELSAQVVNFMERYYTPILAHGRGLNFAQHLYVTGIVYEVAAVQAKDSDSLGKAYEQFRRGLEVSPNRPQFLLGLFDIFRFAHDTPNVKIIGQKILELWPWSTQVRENLDKYLQSAGESR